MPYPTTNEPPFGRGQYQTQASDQSDTNMPFAGILGQFWEFDDLLWNTGANGPPDRRSSGKVMCMLARNDSGSAILPKALCKPSVLTPGSITGLTSDYTDRYFPADEFLPAAGVPDDAIFWVVVEGLCKVVTAASVTANITAGDYLIADATTDGTVNIFDFSLVPTTGTPAYNYWQALKNARARATADRASSGGGAVTITVDMTKG